MAQQQSNAMAAANSLSHDVGGSFTARIQQARLNTGRAAENLGAGYFSTEEAVAGWRASSGHDANLRLPDVTRYGIALTKIAELELRRLVDAGRRRGILIRRGVQSGPRGARRRSCGTATATCCAALYNPVWLGLSALHTLRQFGRKQQSMTDKTATTAHPILPLLAERWSPRAFTHGSRSTTPARLAVRGGALVALRQQPPALGLRPCRHGSEGFARIVESLAPGNVIWAQHAPHLIVGVAELNKADGSPTSTAATTSASPSRISRSRRRRSASICTRWPVSTPTSARDRDRPSRQPRAGGGDRARPIAATPRSCRRPSMSASAPPARRKPLDSFVFPTLAVRCSPDTTPA